jgi:Family of unknown function (DUF7019)
MSAMRYYAYVSDAKVEMLYDQIPPKLRSRIVAELKLDIKVVSVSIRERESDATRYGKLGVVERYMERHVAVGSVAEPGPWFRGQLPLRSGLYRNAPGGLAYFGGSQAGVRLALIGSARHLIGSRPTIPEIGVSYSGVPALYDVLRHDELDAEPPPADSDRDDVQRTLEEVGEFASLLRGVPESCEFLARRLLSGRVADEGDRVSRVLLGTPLYVALADG